MNRPSDYIVVVGSRAIGQRKFPKQEAARRILAGLWFAEQIALRDAVFPPEMEGVIAKIVSGTLYLEEKSDELQAMLIEKLCDDVVDAPSLQLALSLLTTGQLPALDKKLSKKQEKVYRSIVRMAI